jgi:methylphosphotriester-DNA--protein-cysteine methyltransferase
MIQHTALGSNLKEISRKLGGLIRKGEISYGGYRKAKIYGTLHCRSGKRMKIENRVFFINEEEAIAEGYRPCAHCLPGQYKVWKSGQPVLPAAE